MRDAATRGARGASPRRKRGGAGRAYFIAAIDSSHFFMFAGELAHVSKPSSIMLMIAPPPPPVEAAGASSSFFLPRVPTNA